MAKLYFNYGAMASGKTIEVIETAYKYNSRGMKCLVAKSSLDTRDEDKVKSRIGLERDVDILIKPDHSFFEFDLDITCLIVDEAQFLTEKQVYELVYITKKLNIPVICYGLKVDFRGELFTGSEALLRYADTITELVSICNCGKKARFNARKINNEYVYVGEQIVVGSDEKYEPICEKCFLEKVLIPNAIEFQEIEQKVKKKVVKNNLL